MARLVNLVKVLIASPGDCAEERTTVQHSLAAWNRRNRDSGIQFEAVMWETHTVPVEGAEPQYVINQQIVKDCDYGIALFKHRLGTPTKRHQSGTAEEIQELRDCGATVSIFTSTIALPEAGDKEQYEKLQAYLKVGRGNGLRGEFSSPTDLHGRIQDWATHFAKSATASAAQQAPARVVAKAASTSRSLAAELSELAGRAPTADDSIADACVVCREAEYRWGVETNDSWPDFDRCKAVMRELCERMMGEVGRDGSKYPKEARELADKIVHAASSLSKFRFSLDGGKSWKKFKGEGDLVAAACREFAERFDPQ